MSETTARAMRRATSGSLTTPIFPLLAATATGFALPGAERYVHMGPVPPKKDGDHLSFGKFQKRLPVSVHPRHGLSVDAKEDVPLTDPALPGGDLFDGQAPGVHRSLPVLRAGLLSLHLGDADLDPGALPSTKNVHEDAGARGGGGHLLLKFLHTGHRLAPKRSNDVPSAQPPLLGRAVGGDPADPNSLLP